MTAHPMTHRARLRSIRTLTPALFAKITAGFDGEIRYIRLSRRCLIAWHVPAGKGE